MDSHVHMRVWRVVCMHSNSLGAYGHFYLAPRAPNCRTEAEFCLEPSPCPPHCLCSPGLQPGHSLPQGHTSGVGFFKSTSAHASTQAGCPKSTAPKKFPAV
eukprot:215653-Chlamydomonas_euryale.AAC.2